MLPLETQNGANSDCNTDLWTVTIWLVHMQTHFTIKYYKSKNYKTRCKLSKKEPVCLLSFRHRYKMCKLTAKVNGAIEIPYCVIPCNVKLKFSK